MTTGIAIIGAGMIGAAHASGYRTHLPRTGLDARLATVCDMSADQAGSLAKTWGFERTASDWREVIDDPAIGIVSVCLPNFLHGEVARAALAAGKHVLCEKPLATTLPDALRTRDAARDASGISGTVFNYRRIPAVADIRARVASGELGDPVQITVFHQCDYAADPLLPHSWRYEFERAGPGALLDVGTHAVDLARFIMGDVAEVTGAVSTISIPERFLPAGATVGHGHVALSDRTAKVENDDVTSALLRFASGAQGFVTASRVAVGTGNRVQVEVYGTKGTARFSNETPSHFDLAVRDGSGPAPFRRMLNRPSSPGINLAAVPHDLVPIGYAESFGFMIHEFLTAVAEGRPFGNGSIEDGYRAAQVLDAIHRAATTNAPVAIDWRD
ncbi:Gfo/Idh/MocA family protein [Amaricoccus solimangrovi]|uniref:Gfo/Idh/MocA family oxidoreductase n=1 Tax=Amaricoccus solimangrovi TaxID=2589815 RepID=A0A501WPW0_9RHOB|nr:Gfo/Idh/MocA family oxidoreductase [Amaricoccus solimangrovi]TPE49277.1 Gfo/Idh/MocA family oxidoreductase [Amaricoccus solimangrovi]